MNTKYSTIAAFALLTSLALSSCGPGQSADTTQIALSTVSWTPTATAIPTFTVTLMPTSGPTPSGGGAGQIAFCRTGHPNSKIFLIDVDGANLHELNGNTDGANCHPAWSPDGQQIAFEGSDSDGVSQIYIMDADGSDSTALTNSQLFGDVSDPQWSPDGKRVAFVSTLYESDLEECSSFLASCNTEIFVVNTDGKDLTRLTNNSVEDGAPVWSPDGSKIAFYSALDEPDPDHCSYADCNYEIYTMNSDGSEVTRLTDSPTKDWWPAWSPDGMKITYSAYHLDSANPDSMWDIVVMDSDGSNPIMLTKDMGAIVSAWRP